MKKLLTTPELIEHMKEKGITFNIISEEDAGLFLQDKNYYMKLASYRANYSKYETGSKTGQYKNLDFAYLICNDPCQVQITGNHHKLY